MGPKIRLAGARERSRSGFALSAVPIVVLALVGFYGLAGLFSAGDGRDDEAAVPQPILSVGDTVYGPEVFTIPSGTSAVHVEAFSITYLAGARHRLVVVNGGGGANEVTTLDLVLNGAELISDQQALPSGETNVDVFGLPADNDLTLELVGSVGDSVSVALVQLSGPTTTIFGPEEVVRSGGSNSDSWLFDIPPDVKPPYGFHVNNGYPDGTNRTGTATVELNSEQLFGPSDFSTSTAYLETEVLLQDSANLVELTVGGSNGNRVEVYITGVVVDTVPPVVTIESPVPDVVTTEDSVTVSGTVFDTWGTNVEVNGVAAGIVDDSLFSAKVPLNSEGPILLTASATDNSGNQSSDTVTVIYDTTTPALTVTAPTDALVTKVSPTPVEGTATDANGVEVKINGATTSTDGAGAFTDSVSLVSGSNLITVLAEDPAGNQNTVIRTVTLDQVNPALLVDEPSDSSAVGDPQVTVSGSVTDGSAVTVEANAVPLPVDGAGEFTGTVTLSEGSNLLVVGATDAAGNLTEVTRTVRVDTEAPVLAVTAPTSGSTTSSDSVEVSGSVTDSTAVTLTVNGLGVSIDSLGGFAGDVPLAIGLNTLVVLATDAVGNTAVDTLLVTRGVVIPPDPSTVASAIVQNVASTIGATTAFLYEGADPIQTGVSPATIDPTRVAVARGRVLDRDGQPVSGASVSVLNHPEFGQTISRDDGRFDMAMNGGRILNLKVEKAGYPPVQRRSELPSQDFYLLDDIVLTPLDTLVTVIDFSEAIEIARGSAQSDTSGTRQATLMFKQGTTASMTLAGDSVVALSSISVRATEYTVGEEGPEAMPADLPRTTGYTYAVELSVDEAVSAGAERVEFSQPVAVYVENFLGFPVGEDVPSGYFDRQQGEWLPEPDGRVVRIIDIQGGRAELDIDGDSIAEPADTVLARLNINADELDAIGATYSVDDELWRVEVSHFSPFDFNWPLFLDSFVDRSPENPDPRTGEDDTSDDPCEVAGSIIGCESQSLGEMVPIVGTSFSLNYSSLRVPGRSSAYTLDIPLTQDTVPTDLARVYLDVRVAGRRFEYEFDPDPDQSYTFVWDGLDAYGRELLGEHPVRVEVGYAYLGQYERPMGLSASFGAAGGGSGGGAIGFVAARQEVVLRSTWTGFIGGRFIGGNDARARSFGGWSLDVNHAYDPVGGRLYLGDGTTRSAAGVGHIIETVAGTGVLDPDGDDNDGEEATSVDIGRPEDVTVGPDGLVYFIENRRVRRIEPDGTLSTFAGDGGSAPDSVLATSANLGAIRKMDFGPDGSLWMIGGGTKVYRVWPDGIVVEYGDVEGYAGDGGPVWDSSVRFDELKDIAVGPDGSVYVLHGDASSLECLGGSCRKIRRIAPDGTLSRFAGNGGDTYSGDGGAALSASFNQPGALALGPDGSVYVSDVGAIRRITPDGVIDRFAGDGTGYSGDGGQAIDADIWVAQGSMSFGPDGGLYFAQVQLSGNGHVVRGIAPNGIISTAAGTGSAGYSGDGGRPLAGAMDSPTGAALDRNGTLYIADNGNSVVRRVGSALPGFTAGEHVIPSADQSLYYRFSAAGQHLQTFWARTGAPLYTFEYDADNRLSAVIDADSLVTTIQRDQDGSPQSITGPYSQVTTLGVDARGYLNAITNPASEAYAFVTDSTGLLTEFITPTNDTTVVAYGTDGRLSQHTDPSGRVRTWSRVEGGDSVVVTMTTPAGTTTYLTRETSLGVRERRVTSPTGEVATTIESAAGVMTATTPDSVETVAVLRPETAALEDGIEGDSIIVSQPSGLTGIRYLSQSVALADSSGFELIDTVRTTVRVNGRTSTATWARGTNRLVTSSAEGRESTTAFDEYGRVTTSILPGIDSTVITRDSLGRVTDVDQGVRDWGYIYDVYGRLSESTDPLARIMAFEYDSANRLTQQMFPDSSTVSFVYDAAGRIDTLTTPGGRAYTYQYAPDGQITAFVPPDTATLGGAAYVAYDSVGRPSQLSMSGGRQVAFTYDASGRVTASPAGADTLEYEYDPATGNLEQVTRGSEQLTYTTDGNLITEVALSGSVSGTVEFGYSADFWLASESVNGGDTVAYAYDDDGLLVAAGAATLSNDATTGFLSSYVLSGDTTRFTYNAFGELAEEATSVAGFGDVLFRYARDDVGRVTADTTIIAADTLVWSYGYDDLGQLESVDLNGSAYATYGYDASGNRTSVVDGGGSRTLTPNSQDQATSFGTATYAYDGSGILERKVVGADTTTYSYDDFGNLTEVALPTGDTIAYTIDPMQRRVAIVVNGTVTQRFLYRDGLNPVAEVDGSGATVTRFVYGSRGNVPDYMIRGGATYRILSDQRGSVRAVVDVAGDSLVQRLDYGPWGEVLVDTNPGWQPFGFAGGLYTPETGLVRFGARDYDPALGRWTAKDPLLFDGGDTNLYAYAANDPVNFVDPTGQVVWDLLDVYFFLQDLRNFGRCPSIGSALWAGAGFISLWPGIPNASLFTHIPNAGKKSRQLVERGWSRSDVHELVNNPFVTRPAHNRATGNSATAFFRSDGHHVIRDDVTADLVQVSDRRDRIGHGPGEWKPDRSIVDPFIPGS